MRYQVKYLKILAPILDTLVNLGFEKFFAYSLFFDRVVEEWTESVVEPLLYCVRNLKNTQFLWIFEALIPKSRNCSSFSYGGVGSERKGTDCMLKVRYSDNHVIASKLLRVTSAIRAADKRRLQRDRRSFRQKDPK